MRKRIDKTVEISRRGLAGFLFGHPRLYYMVLANVGLITVIGLVMVLSSSSIDAIANGDSGFSPFLKQLLAGAVGVVLLVAASRIGTSTYRRFARAALLLSVVFQLATVFVFGYSVNGNTNWIKIAGFTFQPSELVKLTLIVYLADWFASREGIDDDQRNFGNAITLGGVALLSVLAGKDLGTAIVMFGILLGVLVFARMPWSYFFGIVSASTVALLVLLNTSGSRIGRINAWLHPDWPDPNQFNWQQDKAKWAFAAGGPTGVGLGKSQLKWSWLPESENDFIFAIIGEELGLLGALAIVALFVWLTRSLLKASELTSDSFGRYLLLGLMLWIGIQSTVNIGVVVGYLPVLGVPLPFVSSGGSSLLILLLGIGFAVGVIRESASPVRRIR